MQTTPEIVGTGLHVPKVHFWARVLVRPDRLQQVKHNILTMGLVFLKPGEVVEIDTRPGDDMKHAMTVGDHGATKPFPACIVTWNEIVGDITIYADDAAHLAAIADPVATALAHDADEFINSQEGRRRCNAPSAIRSRAHSASTSGPP